MHRDIALSDGIQRTHCQCALHRIPEDRSDSTQIPPTGIKAAVDMEVLAPEQRGHCARQSLEEREANEVGKRGQVDFWAVKVCLRRPDAGKALGFGFYHGPEGIVADGISAPDPVPPKNLRTSGANLPVRAS